MCSHRIRQDVTVECEKYRDDETYRLIVEAICPKLDLPVPVVLSKHKRDLAGFGRVKFLPGDFMEPVDFDWFEIEYIPEKK